ncbi:MAG: T9SS type A sorting domain-containing protein, partial [Bacteroidales bacterium]|nr:T9SS type A sorting domain-containing protein [Bacteroidales bacterium]
NGQILKTTPNPFKNELTIEYYLLNNYEASIYIYSLTGKQIGHINANNQKTGWNSCTWKPSESSQAELTEGLNFIVLKQGSATIVQKVIYSK